MFECLEHVPNALVHYTRVTGKSAHEFTVASYVIGEGEYSTIIFGPSRITVTTVDAWQDLRLTGYTILQPELE